MCFMCKICFTVYTGETKINDTYFHILLNITIDNTSLLFALPWLFSLSCSCWCSVALPRGSVSWSAVCDYDISWSSSVHI